MLFNKLDLNLLVAFDALCKERNITRAAERLHMSQSAMSHALRRLRTYFDDDLLVQVGRKMELTQRARTLHEAVRDTLQRLENALSASPAFDPSKSDRTFTIFASDYSLELVIPRMLQLAARQGSRVRFRLEPQINHPDRPLERGEADLMLIPNQFCSKLHPSATLFEESLVCLMWRDSALATEPLTLERFLSAGHVAMMPVEAEEAAFERPLAERVSAGRRIEVATYNFSSLPHLVIGTEYLALVQRRLARTVQTTLPLVVREVPLPMPPLVQSMQWHKYRNDDAGLLWLRSLMHEVGDSFATEGNADQEL
jgi:DNA-binding transcriptional LysR family regulator